MSTGIFHNFISGKIDSTDTTLVSSSEWNAALQLRGGVNGWVPSVDTAKPQRFRFIERIRLNANSVTITSPVASPQNNVAPLAITVDGNSAVLMVFYNIYLFESTTGVAATFDLKLNTTTQISRTVIKSGIRPTAPITQPGLIVGYVPVYAAGVYTFSITITTANGENIAQWGTLESVVSFGT